MPRKGEQPRAISMESIFMIGHPTDSANSQSRAQRHSLLSARRLALMASVAIGLGVGICGFGVAPGAFDIVNAAYAEVNQAVSSAAQPTGFADMVERVKPSVISVKVTMKATDASDKSDGEGSGSPMERFFHRFGGPDGAPQKPGRNGRQDEMMGQGSGFFISSDGYAVTNNHVVEGADKVEITTDAGKITLRK